ncbi:response regulator transcription factor [Lacticaseibacillus daqingensis]|uniref:response regulator transcription factor n=1 Tax=Lacticaseibacillus daqingensis TaxID=2486014 RepID=UPI000F795B96|nr:response regulator transcription factor [Lacticaseibacillus daqingensis]
MRLLIVEDEPALRASMAAFFAQQATVQAVGTLAAASTAVAAGPDAIILDLTLPDGDGLAWLREWRPSLAAKVLVLTANDSEAAELAGLRLADEYVVKPISLPVLAARLRRLWPAVPIQLGAVTVGLADGQVTRNGRVVDLTATEWRLLAFLVTNRKQIVSREQLMAALWDAREAYVTDNTLTVTIKRLREKLEADPAHPQLIRTIRGMGYFIDEQA